MVFSQHGRENVDVLFSVLLLHRHYDDIYVSLFRDAAYKHINTQDTLGFFLHFLSLN